MYHKPAWSCCVWAYSLCTVNNNNNIIIIIIIKSVVLVNFGKQWQSHMGFEPPPGVSSAIFGIQRHACGITVKMASNRIGGIIATPYIAADVSPIISSVV